ncbi:MAG: glycosyltransferase family 4 protein [Acidobacteriia bacterium]|nr:glycosyltransferase family 4 protein [Terriglobia bacterium]
MPTVAPRAVTESTSAKPHPGAKVVLSHSGTGPYVQHAARALHEAGLLGAYVTSFHYDRNSALGKFLRTALGLVQHDAELQLSRRAITEVPPELIRGHATPEIIRMTAARLASPMTADLVWERAEKWFDSMVAREHLQGAAAVYSYEFSSLATFQAQKQRGGLCIYDMATCHHATAAKWVGEEFDRFTELLTPYEKHRRRLAPLRNSRKDQELALADRVVVASNFVRDSLLSTGVAEEKICVVPTGAPPVDTSHRHPDPGKFVFLVAGNLSVQKGIHYALAAWRRISAHSCTELWMVGNWKLPERMREGLPGKVWVSPFVLREKLYELFDRANVMVFPTLAEGLATTPLQAMARGLPVITTRNSGCDSFIRPGENGWLVSPRDVDALVAAMEAAIARPADTEAIGRAAAASMAQWQWSDYHATLGRTVLEILRQGPAAR